MIKIFDDIISVNDQEEIKNLLLGRDFTWHYLQDITKQDGLLQKRPAFSHYFVLDEKNNSNWSDITNNIIINSCIKAGVSCQKVLESRAFLQLPNVTKEQTIDTPHIDRRSKHTVILYYVKTSDGDTIIYDGDKEHTITPKQGRVVVFNGLLKHTAKQPTNDSRCIINVNIC